MISILLATYNWPQALKLCLESLATQTDQNFEIIIADDGSSESTKHLIEYIKTSHPITIKHLWQEDCGFQKTKILNKAIAAAHGNYLVFLDGDCIVQPDFVAQHRALAQKGCLVTGSRVLLNESLTQELLAWPQWSFQKFSSGLLGKRLSGGINKYWPLKV
jgi:glycosyltransferase involved in cell wall biosynthesis